MESFLFRKINFFYSNTQLSAWSGC